APPATSGLAKLDPSSSIGCTTEMSTKRDWSYQRGSSPTATSRPSPSLLRRSRMKPAETAEASAAGVKKSCSELPAAATTVTPAACAARTAVTSASVGTSKNDDHRSTRESASAAQKSTSESVIAGQRSSDRNQLTS